MKKQFGFTLVEMLLAIAVFATGILSVLYAISHTLANQNRTEMTITASFLAREGIELLFNLRDSNYQKELPRNCVFKFWNGGVADLDKNPFCEDYLGSGDAKIFQISPNNGSGFLLIEKQEALKGLFEDDFASHKLYYHTGSQQGGLPFWFDHKNTSDDELNFFARYLLLTGVVENGALLPLDKILKIESHVLYQRGGLTGEVVIDSFLGNYE